MSILPPPSLSGRLIRRLSLAIGLVYAAVCSIYLVREAHDEDVRLQADAGLIATNIAETLEQPLWNLDAQSITLVGKVFSKNELISRLTIRDADGSALYAFDRGAEPGGLTRQVAVRHQQVAIGTVEVVFTTRRYWSAFWRIAGSTAVTAALIIVVVFLWTGHLVRKLLRDPVAAFSRAVRAYASDGVPEEASPPDIAEFREFSAVLTAMGVRIRSQLAELQRHREHLEELVLQRTRELDSERQRVDQYFTVASALTVVLDLRGDIVRINPYGCELLGWTMGELVGRNWFRTCLPEDTREAVHAYFLALASDSASLGAASFVEKTYENDVITRTGAVLRLLFRNAWVRDGNGRIDGTLSSAIDISAVRATEAALREAKEGAERASRAKSRFLANMSHEIRTPLNAVLGYAQLLDRSATFPPEHRKAIQVINRSGEHLLHLINDILEMSRIEAERSSCDAEDFDLHALLDNLASLFFQRVRDKGLELALRKDAALPRFIRTDQRKLRQILINLLSNAVKFTSHGHIEVTAQAADGRLVLAVADSGCGMEAEDTARLFQAFFQAGEGRRRSEGTGLGLAISQGFARLLGGALRAASTPGVGSAFTLDIPIAAATSAARHITQRRLVGLAPGQRQPRLLIAEDHRESRELLTELLQTAGCQVEAVADGAAAVAACRRERPDLVWVDIDLPVLDGLAATAAIRALPDPPLVVALTAAAFAEDRQRILAAGCADIVPKPYREDELFTIMERLLGLRFIWSTAEVPATGPSPEPLAPDQLLERLKAVAPTARARLAETVVIGDTAACHGLLASWSDRPLADALSVLIFDFAFDRVGGLLDAAAPA